MSDIITILPTDERAERAVLSCILQNPPMAYEAPEITPEWFWFEPHRVLWRAMKSALDGERCRQRFLQRVIADLEDSKQLEKLGPLTGRNNAIDWITGVIQDQVSPVSAWDIQLPRLRNAWRRRKSYEHLTRAAERVIRTGQDVDTVLDEVVKSASTIAASNTPEKENISQFSKDVFEWAIAGGKEIEADGITIPIEPLERLNIKAVPGHFTVLAARPKQGKSRLAIRMAFELAKNGVSIDFWSQEMSRWDIVKLLATCSLGFDIETLKTKDALKNYQTHQKLAEMTGTLNGLDINIYSGPAHIRDIWFKTMARRVRIGDKPFCIFVDYIQVFDGEGKNEHERIADVSKTLAGMSRNYDCWVCGLAQFNRSAAEGVPKAHQLRGSGQLEQDANELLILHRPAAEKGNATDLEQNTGQLILALNRHGDPGETQIHCDLEKLKFRSSRGFA